MSQIATHTLDNIIAHVSKRNPQRLVPSAPDARYRTETIKLQLPCVRDLLEQAYTVFLELPPNASLDHAFKADRPYLHPHVKHLHNLARKAVLLTMAQETVAYPTFEQYEMARAADIDLLPSPPALEPWTPNTAETDREPAQLPSVPLPETGALLCEPFQFPAPVAQSLKLAFDTNELAGNLFFTSEKACGYSWYQELPIITAIRLSPEKNPDGMRNRPQTLSLTLETTTVSGNSRPPATLQTPALFPPHGWQPDQTPWEQSFALSANPNLTTETLATHLIDSYFDPSQNVEAPSWTEQRIRFEDEALFVGATLLEGPLAAFQQLAERIAHRELCHYLPPGTSVSLTLTTDTVKVQVASG